MALLCLSREDEKILKQITTEIQKPTPGDFKIECQTLLTDSGGEWYLNNMCYCKPYMKKPRLIKKQQ